jgi:hypothetical protein
MPQSGNREGNIQGCIQMGVTDIRQYALLPSERRASGNEEDAHFLKCGMVLLRCLGFHPVLKRPSSLIINGSPSILDNERGHLS